LSYEVIARRWRPQDFGGLIGQDHIRTTLQNALKANRLHHALLFTGPRGTGKTSTARILAKSLRCPNAVDFVPCNKCAECEEISSGRSMNVVEIDGASNNGVDAIRELRDTVGYLPSTGKFKMYIIDEVHMLSTSAFNALLKTLEEPPGHVYFVMATTEVHKIPNTILSRTQRFDFRRIPTRVIAQHLQTICERDGIRFEPDALWTIARQGDGSMRDSQSLLDQTINFTNGHLQRDLVVSTLGLTDRGLLNNLLAALMKRDVATALDGVKALHNAGGDPKLFLLDVMEQIRNALLLKLNADKSMIDLPDSEQEALLKMSAELTPEDLHLLFDMALKGAQDLARASDALLILEMVLMRMATAPRVNFAVGSSRPSPAPQARAVQAPRPAANISTGNDSRMAAASAAGSSPVLGTTLVAESAPTPMEPSGPTEQRFKQLVEKIKDVNGLVGAQLENCFVVKLEGKELTIGVSQKHKFLYDNLNKPEFKKKVVNYINSFWGAGYTLNIVLSEPAGGEQSMTPKALGEKLEADRRDELRKAIEAHPLVKSAQSVFKTEIKSIKAFPPGKP
jgi:DNA polymerase-3 subunit gamma/tau